MREVTSSRMFSFAYPAALSPPAILPHFDSSFLPHSLDSAPRVDSTELESRKNSIRDVSIVKDRNVEKGVTNTFSLPGNFSGARSVGAHRFTRKQGSDEIFLQSLSPQFASYESSRRCSGTLRSVQHADIGVRCTASNLGSRVAVRLNLRCFTRTTKWLPNCPRNMAARRSRADE